MATTLLTNGYLVTVDPDRRVIPSGYVLIEDDRIKAIGPMADLGGRTADTTVDLHGMLTLPGFVNGHNHHWASLFKNTGEGLLLEPWLDLVTLPLMFKLTNADLRVAAYLGALEQLKTGTTTSINHVVNVNDEESMAAIVEPVVDIGIRQLVCKEVRDTPNPPFTTKYPAYPHVRSRGEELALAEAFVDRWEGAGGVVHTGLAIETGANWMLHNATSDEVIIEGVELAKRRNLKITNHCGAGTPWLSIKEFEEQTGGGDVDYLVRLGALTDNWVLIHCLWLKDREIDAIARAGASVITNPVSNAYSCDGIAPLAQMFRAGVNVGLGSDGAYVNCSMDMVEQMKFATLLQNVTHLDPNLMSAERAIEMATINGAKAIGLDHEIGSLEVGKRADIVSFDLFKPHSMVGNKPISQLVFSGHGTDVDTVLVNGKLKLRGGDWVEFDREREVLEEAQARAAEVIDRAGIGDRVYVDWRK